MDPGPLRDASRLTLTVKLLVPYIIFLTSLGRNLKPETLGDKLKPHGGDVGPWGLNPDLG